MNGYINKNEAKKIKKRKRIIFKAKTIKIIKVTVHSATGGAGRFTSGLRFLSIAEL